MSQQIGAKCVGHTDAVVELSFSRDLGSGFYLASAGLDGIAMMRHGDTGHMIGNLRKHKAGVWSVSLNEDARILASGGADGKVRIWDALLGKQLTKYTHEETVSCLDLDPKGSRLVSGCLGLEPAVSLYDLEKSGKKPLMTFRGHQRGIRDLTFCLEENCILTSSYDRNVKMWDCRSGERTHSIVLTHHAKTVELHHDREIVTIAFERSVIFLDPRTFEILKTRKCPFKVTSAALHPRKESYACGNIEGVVYKYDYETGLPLGCYQGRSKSAICFLRFSPDGEICAMALANGNIILWRQNMDKKYGLWTTVMSSDEGAEEVDYVDADDEGEEEDLDGEENESMS
ncbi:serine-threonine kinase receptor-associated protein [Drosophila biarmipes]|uniref:serine-threonine kinase receptor-associated protein n=1 Tax=Drosophila biarmipes TaxID=125945 RepID=UPI0007E70FE8|nr:serine-threonine kinase receptor-associated protein [Drosophila biarmipes]